MLPETPAELAVLCGAEQQPEQRLGRSDGLAGARGWDLPRRRGSGWHGLRGQLRGRRRWCSTAACERGCRRSAAWRESGAGGGARPQARRPGMRRGWRWASSTRHRASVSGLRAPPQCAMRWGARRWASSDARRLPGGRERCGAGGAAGCRSAARADRSGAGEALPVRGGERAGLRLPRDVPPGVHRAGWRRRVGITRR
jgi:hypothetical protein